MNINDYSPMSGRIIGEDGKTYNLADFLDSGLPVSGKAYDINSYMPRSGRIIGEDGKVYNLVDILKNLNTSGQEEEECTSGTIRIDSIEILPYGESPRAENIGTDKDAVYILFLPEGRPGADGKDGTLEEIAGASKLLYFTQVGTGVGSFRMVTEKPTAPIVIDTGWHVPPWGEYHTIARFTHGAEFGDDIFEVIPGAKFSAHFLARATAVHNGVNFRFRAIDTTDGTVFASALDNLNLTNDGVTRVPANFSNIYHLSRSVRYQDIVVEIQIRSTHGGVGISLLSSPEEAAYVSAFQPGGAISPTVEVGNVTSGDEASVVNTGSAARAVLDFVLPRGEQGIPGKSAYEFAVEGGFTGSEEEFASYINSLGDFNAILDVIIGE